MIEPLESRIALAAILTFFEADGDKVTIKTSKGTNAGLTAATGINQGQTGVNSVAIIFVTNPAIAAEFANTNITITAAGGTGFTQNQVNDVSINAYNSGSMNSIDLGKVVVKGNLRFLDAGDSDLTTKAVKSITTTFWGPESASSAVSSEIQGNIGSVKVKRIFNGYIISRDAAGNANFQDPTGTVIGSFIVGDRFGGMDADDNGHLQVNRIAKLVVKEFFGAADQTLKAGLIEADSIGKMSIKNMDNFARIILT